MPARKKSAPTVVDVRVNPAPVQSAVVKSAGQGVSRSARRRRARRLRSQLKKQGFVVPTNRLAGLPSLSQEIVSEEALKSDVEIVLEALTQPKPGMKVPSYTVGGIGQPLHRMTVQHVYNLNSTEVGSGVTAFLFRRPGANLILIQAPPTLAKWKYQYMFMSMACADGTLPNTGGGSTWTPVANQEYDIKSVMGIFVPQDSFDFKKNDDDYIILASKDYPEKRFMYMDAGEAITFTGTPTANSTFTLKAYRLFDGNLNLESSTNSAAITGGNQGSVSYTIVNSGYYCFTFSNSAATTINSLSFVSSGLQVNVAKVTRHLCMNYYCANIQWLPKTRFISSTLLGTNSTAELYLGGDCVQANISGGIPWEGLASYASLAALPSAVPLDAREGTFSQLRIVNREADLDLKTLSVNSGGANPQLTDSLETVEADADYVGVSFSLAGLGGNQLLKFTLDSCVEFLSLNPMFPGEYGSTDPEAWAEAVIKASAIPQFTANKIHFSQITRAIKDVAKTSVKAILKYGPVVVKGAELVASYLGQGAEALL